MFALLEARIQLWGSREEAGEFCPGSLPLRQHGEGGMLQELEPGALPGHHNLRMFLKSRGKKTTKVNVLG